MAVTDKSFNGNKCINFAHQKHRYLWVNYLFGIFMIQNNLPVVRQVSIIIFTVNIINNKAPGQTDA